ncbi:MAG: hypothetical protein AAGF20_08230 [Pseudomonadota bacterium]
MHWSLFAFAAIALIGAHMLRLPQAGGRFGAFTAFSAGLLVTALGIKAFVAYHDLGRTTDYDRFVNAAVATAKQDPAPLIVFSGASYSRNGIDPERLTLALRERGYPHRVINLSIEAASIFERDAHLDQFINLSGRTPEVVFVEVAQEFDHRAAFIFGNSKFSARAIEHFDLRTTAWTVFAIAGGGCYNRKDCITDLGFTGLHSGLNLLNIGLISKAERPADSEGQPAYDPQHKPRRDSDPSQASLVNTPEAKEGLQWIRSYRAGLEKRLKDRGTAAIGYYQPPVLDPDRRVYMESLCLGEFAGKPCLHSNDAELMAALEGDYWLDPGHLLDSGTAIYNRWLIEQLIGTGALEKAPSQAVAAEGAA